VPRLALGNPGGVSYGCMSSQTGYFRPGPNVDGKRNIPLEDLPDKLPEIDLRHGQALWLLSELGFRGGASQSTFREYIKSLRKLGIPFERRKIGGGRRRLAIYSYCRLMELALGLTLRVYNVVPDAILVELVRFRKSLDRFYRIAYEERLAGRGAPVVVTTQGHPPIHLRGLFLDLQIDFFGGKLVNFGPPRVLTPFEALVTSASSDVAARAFLPIALSALSERVVALSLRAPPIRTGPRAAVKPDNRRRESKGKDIRAST
jgi:hypothetical protein